jgi:hypothetical protein
VSGNGMAVLGAPAVHVKDLWVVVHTKAPQNAAPDFFLKKGKNWLISFNF